MTHYLDNGHGRVGVLPSLGGKLFSLFDIDNNKELLWSPEGVNYTPYEGTEFDSQWTGGFDDMFPNDIPCIHNGVAYRDHGILWDMDFDCVVDHNTMQLNGMNTLCRFTKQLILQYDEKLMQNILKANYTLTYTGDASLEYIFKLHPAFAIDKSSVLTLPGSKVYCDEDYNSYDCPGRQYVWPLMAVKGGDVIDVSRAASFKDGDSLFHYITLTDGFFCLESSRGAVCMYFDKEFFPYITIYQQDGFTIIEPCTGIPANIGIASAQNQTRIIHKGESISTSFKLAFSSTLQK